MPRMLTLSLPHDHVSAAGPDVVPRRPAARRHAPRVVRAGRQPSRRLPRALRGDQRRVVPPARDAGAGDRRPDRVHAPARDPRTAVRRVRRSMAAQTHARVERSDPRGARGAAAVLGVAVADLRDPGRAQHRVELFRSGAVGHDPESRPAAGSALGERADADRHDGGPHHRSGGRRGARRRVWREPVLRARYRQLPRVRRPHRYRGDRPAGTRSEGRGRVGEQPRARRAARHVGGHAVHRAPRRAAVRRARDGGGAVHDRLLRSADRDLRPRVAARELGRVRDGERDGRRRPARRYAGAALGRAPRVE